MNDNKITRALDGSEIEVPFVIHANMVFLILDIGNADVYSVRSLYRYLRLALPAALTGVSLSLRNDCLLVLAGYFAHKNDSNLIIHTTGNSR